jgi:MOSC domain-containing protein YiiM
VPELQGHIVSVQVGASRLLRVGERTVRSAICKQALAGPVAVGPLGLAGDEQNDLSVHGGLSKAVYALPHPHLAWWSAQRQAAGASLLADTFEPGQLGENLSLDGVDEHSVFVGDRLRFAGGVVLRVTEPRQPCAKFNAVLGYERAGKDMVHSGRCGFYLAVEVPGALTAGETFVLEAGARQTCIAQALQHKAFKHLR